jgi:quercetin dioxygenase-like cupin family protein
MRLARLLLLAALGCGLAAAQNGGTEKLRNDRVAAVEYTLRPGETAALDAHPAVTVYFADGRTNASTVRRGDVVFSPAGVGALKNTGTSDLRFIRVGFLRPASSQTWGAAGLSPNYRMLIENPYTRTYEIKIPAGSREPQHTHNARVVVCLSGALLKHIMPDGREEPSTLKEGEVAFRPGSTHIGVNLGNTDLWVIAIEPK